MDGRLLTVREAWIGLAIALLLAISILYAVVQPAIANHYHDHGCTSAVVTTGLVQGNDNNDGSYFSVVRSNGCLNSGRGTETCGLRDNASGWAWNKFASPNAECSLWSGETSGRPPECRSYAAVDYNGVFVSHAHYPHSVIC